MIACTNCSNPIKHDPAAGQLPPWCSHCGASLRFDGTKASVPEEPQLEALAPDAVPATTTFETMEPLPETPPRTYGMVMKAGVVLLGLAAVLAYKAATDADAYSRTTGTVVDVVPSGGGTRPEVAYEVANKKYTMQGEESGLFVKAHSAGQQVEVLYMPAHPEGGHLYCPEDEWWWVELVGGAGVAFLVAWRILRKRAAARKW
jgi:hypothetical protein